MSNLLNKDSEYAKNRKKFTLLKVIFSPMFFIILFCIIEILLIFYFLDEFTGASFQIFINILHIGEIIYIVNSKKIKDSFKVTWMIVFIMMPVFGVVLYFILSFSNIFNGYRGKLKDIVIQSKKYLDFSHSDEILEKRSLTKDSSDRELSFFNYFYNWRKFSN